jgi:hypothetical protein
MAPLDDLVSKIVSSQALPVNDFAASKCGYSGTANMGLYPGYRTIDLFLLCFLCFAIEISSGFILLNNFPLADMLELLFLVLCLLPQPALGECR